ncbi:MAG: DUF3800 domain-containing protein [Candidatus Moranbacteria bacterium]|nr:DUF3800 domain-containing protein [Candidatus Moranbacteria bacterium]
MKRIRIYSDESRHKNERFLLLGGLWIEEEKVRIVEELIGQLRKESGYTRDDGQRIAFLGEFKWKKVSDKYIAVYKQLVDIFFDCIEKDAFRFCVMLVDTHNPVVVEQSNIKKEGYFKLLYQLYLHNSKIPALYRIHPDSITNPAQDKVDFSTLDKCLDRAFLKKFSPLVNPADLPNGKGFVEEIVSVNSKSSEFIQLVDVVMGGIGYFQNRLFTNPDAKKAKIELMKYIFDKLIYSGTIQTTGKRYIVARSTKFNIWVFRPKNKKDPQAC